MVIPEAKEVLPGIRLVTQPSGQEYAEILLTPRDVEEFADQVSSQAASALKNGRPVGTPALHNSETLLSIIDPTEQSGAFFFASLLVLYRLSQELGDQLATVPPGDAKGARNWAEAFSQLSNPWKQVIKVVASGRFAFNNYPEPPRDTPSWRSAKKPSDPSW